MFQSLKKIKYNLFTSWNILLHGFWSCFTIYKNNISANSKRMFQFTARFNLYTVKQHKYTYWNIVGGKKIETDSFNTSILTEILLVEKKLKRIPLMERFCNMWVICCNDACGGTRGEMVWRHGWCGAHFFSARRTPDSGHFQKFYRSRKIPSVLIWYRKTTFHI